MPITDPVLRRLNLHLIIPALALLGACAAPEAGPDRSATSAGAPPGAQVYQRRCSVCHGEKGNGFSHARSALSRLPRDFTTDSARVELTREYMIAIVRDGRPGSPMVGRSAQLSQAEIESVVDYVRTAFIPPDPATPAGQGLGLYRAWCASCHGVRGEGGPARAGIRRAPEVSLQRPDSRLTAERLLAAMTADSHLTAMEGRKLDTAERQAVVAYVRQAFIEPLGSTASRQLQPPGAPAP